MSKTAAKTQKKEAEHQKANAGAGAMARLVP